ncbi:hypothetical protein RISK_000046 [Rhodopirellula islandica]|uniref:DUF1559 domain-containing protein n=2 Tax=Rhodopirellula islandica TaxID=595434 RepID=A0A0J1BMY9_RHOIS|nr:DUF1559 domain-containing protein [Rhodopirellula islandica]KLU07867.1 hypothetical protein RISK_000046 [Rhodopirellula islandica]
MAVIGLLLGLATTAIQAARESSRRTTCVNRLRQLDLALQHFEGVTNDLPGFWNHPSQQSKASLSGFFHLLPFLEREALFQAWKAKPGFPWKLDSMLERRDTPPLSDPIFVCPSDDQMGGGNYRFNGGSTISLFSTHRVPSRNGDAPFAAYVGGSNRLLDGRSSTAAFSERLKSRRDGSYHHHRDIFLSGAYGLFPDGSLTDELMIGMARELGTRRPAKFEDFAGFTPFAGGKHQSVYDHVFVPNEPVASISAYEVRRLSSGVRDGAIMATSNHPGGVHVAQFDGAVRFVVDTVDREVYHQLGSRLVDRVDSTKTRQ